MTSPTPTGLTVYALDIDHAQGGDLTLYRTQAEAEAAVIEYVEFWWEQELGRNLPKRRDMKMVERYFEAKREGGAGRFEAYSIETLTVHGTPPPVAPPADLADLPGRWRREARLAAKTGEDTASTLRYCAAQLAVTLRQVYPHAKA